MMDKMSFTYDGINSKDFGIANVSIRGGMYEEGFYGNTSIDTRRSIYGTETYLGRYKVEPIKFTLELAFLDDFPEEERMERIINWLVQEEFKPLEFEGSEKITYCLAVGEPKISHNGWGGYLTIEMQSNSPYRFSKTYNTEIKEIRGTETIEIVNRGSVPLYPILKFKKIGDGDIDFINNGDGGKLLTIQKLKDGEEIYIDCHRKIVETNFIGTYRYDNTHGTFLKLPFGSNEIVVKGSLNLQIEYRYKYKF